MRRAKVVWALALMSIFAAAGCNSPTSPGSGDVVLRGHLVGGAGAAARAGVWALSGAAADDPIIVTVEEAPEITAEVGADGSFTLRGLPEGEFTLVFTLGGAEIGRQTFTEVAPNQEITVTVEVVNGEVVLIDESRTGIGHVDVELQGEILEIVAVDPLGDSQFVIQAKRWRGSAGVVIARPGVTAIRQGNTRLSVEDLEVGMQVHVKAAFIDDSDDVLAYEIKVQDDEDVDDDGEDGEKVTICHKGKNTLSVGASAWPAHERHGDTLGACGS
jgi:hypothetical protein